jgi:hypothetical protein
MLGEMECDLFNVNEILPSINPWSLENQSVMKE